jgi:hypothetical protein
MVDAVAEQVPKYHRELVLSFILRLSREGEV